MCPKQPAVWQIECVLFSARGMFGRRVERIETMPFVFNVRPVCEREAHSPKNFDRALPHLGEWMQRADLMRTSRERDIDPGERFGFFSRTKTCRVRFERRGDGIANFIEQFSNDRLFIFAERSHPLAPSGNAAASAQILYA